MKYLGALNESKMSEVEMKAYSVWKNQRRRCMSKKNKSYKTYGALGISVEYSSREFIGWFVESIVDCPIPIGSVVVGRIDHSRNYSLANICLETKLESIKEMLTRTGRRRRTAIYSEKNGMLLAIVDSRHQAAKLTGVGQSVISLGAKRRRNGVPVRKKRSGFIFKEVI